MRYPRPLAVALGGVLGALVLAGCGTSGPDESTDETTDGADAARANQEFPDVVEVEASEESDGVWSFDVTVSSPYDTPERYADGWRVVAGGSADGDVLGEHELTHDHASEQPFTRTQTGVEVPDDVTEVTVEGRDLENGYGGSTQTVALDQG